jgi:hypothetical protein
VSGTIVSSSRSGLSVVWNGVLCELLTGTGKALCHFSCQRLSIVRLCRALFKGSVFLLYLLGLFLPFFLGKGFLWFVWYFRLVGSSFRFKLVCLLYLDFGSSSGCTVVSDHFQSQFYMMYCYPERGSLLRIGIGVVFGKSCHVLKSGGVLLSDML